MKISRGIKADWPSYFGVRAGKLKISFVLDIGGMKMLRFLMLSLVLLLITQYGGLFGQDEELAQVLRLTKLPVESQE
jgi:hypothetical protein